ncbi:hypothetical protein TNCV_3608431 [Trichonephila clavipes]|nr:hypothetical protein TNCV_3608431 [Trichonephila clavipes]
MSPMSNTTVGEIPPTLLPDTHAANRNAPSSRKSSHEVRGRGREVGGLDHPQSVLPQNWSETELNRSVTCLVLKAKANDRRHLALCPDEFRGP